MRTALVCNVAPKAPVMTSIALMTAVTAQVDCNAVAARGKMRVGGGTETEAGEESTVGVGKVGYSFSGVR